LEGWMKYWNNGIVEWGRLEEWKVRGKEGILE
jgi:hypothetical protein